MLRKLAIAALLTLGACATGPVAQSPAPSTNMNAESLIALASICGADAAAGKAFPENLKLSDGMGTGGFKADTTVADAQTWFDYGLALSHAFYHEDAKGAMKKAVAADPTCSLCAFGEAYVLGPTLNYRINDEQRKAALAAAERAKTLAKPGDAKALRLAEATVARYLKADKSTEPAYGKALAKIAADYPDEIELSVIAAHSLMIPVRGGDKSGLKPSLAIIERVLAQSPNDTGAIHYYIHGTEFDGRAQDALPYAKRLGDLAPMASHLVHMPAHTFFRVGLYHEAAVVNAKAIGADAKWLRLGGDGRDPAPMYYAHNLSFGLAGALMAGDRELALKYADHALLVWPMKEGAAANNTLARTWVALALYAPDRALAIPEQPKGSRPATWRAYARGEALIRMGDIVGAEAEAANLAKPETGTEPPDLAIARLVLQGRIAMAKGENAKAADFFLEGASIQDTRLADSWDPPSWWYPVRRSAAAAYLAAGEPAKAAAEARKSLELWEHDPLALWVLSAAEERRGKGAAGQAYRSEARRIWRGDLSRIQPASI